MTEQLFHLNFSDHHVIPYATTVHINRNQIQWLSWMEMPLCVTCRGLSGDVLRISDHTAEDSQQPLREGLQGLWPRGLVSVYNDHFSKKKLNSTWCNNLHQSRPPDQRAFTRGVPLMFHGRWMLFEGQPSKLFCHWQITRQDPPTRDNPADETNKQKNFFLHKCCSSRSSNVFFPSFLEHLLKPWCLSLREFFDYFILKQTNPSPFEFQSLQISRNVEV